MDPSVYDEMLEQENAHWWFLTRRRIIKTVLQRLKLPTKATILDAGCGSGGNLPMLSGLGVLYAFEMNDKARAHAKNRQLATIEAGRLPDAIPFPGQTFDLITLFDVLEHVEDDNAALSSLVDRLKPGGVLCINVPAHQWLFVRHDRLHHHFRRYGRSELISKVKAAGLDVEFISYWNFLLFPVAVIARLLDGLGIPKNDTIGAKMPSNFINRLLYILASSERLLLPYVRLPFGLSLLILAKKDL